MNKIINLNIYTMKTMKSLITVTVLGLSTIIFSGNAFAFFDVVPVKLMDKTVVQVTVPNNLTTQVYVSNHEGEIIHRNSIQKHTPSKIFNFSSLENGIYTFHAVSEQADVTKKIMIEDSSIEVISKEVEYKPTFIIEDDKIMVNYLNLDKEEIEMFISNSYSDLYRNSEGNSGVFQKIVNISGLDTGEYFAMIKAGDKKFIQSFYID